MPVSRKKKVQVFEEIKIKGHWTTCCYPPADIFDTCNESRTVCIIINIVDLFLIWFLSQEIYQVFGFNGPQFRVLFSVQLRINIGESLSSFWSSAGSKSCSTNSIILSALSLFTDCLSKKAFICVFRFKRG